MMPLELRGKKALVVGLARSGLAAARFLFEQGAEVTVTDLKSRRELRAQIDRLPAVKLVLGKHQEQDFLQSDLIVISPGVPTTLPQLQRARSKRIPVLGEVELAYRFLEGPIVGVTGSNGKTTTTSLIGWMFRQSGRSCRVGGNIGTPLLDLVTKPTSGEPPHYVVELSSFQLEIVDRFHCQIALLLNITPDHQDRYLRFEDYVEAKERIFRNQTPQDFAIVNADDPLTRAMWERRNATVMPFSRRRRLDPGVSVSAGRICIRWQGESNSLLPIDQVGIPGVHNLENALAATAAGYLAGLELKAVTTALRSFSGVEHRLEKLHSPLPSVDFFNDSKATNPEATLKAIRSFDRPLVLILGGLEKGADFEVLLGPLQQQARQVILLGETASRLEHQLAGKAPTKQVESLEEALQAAVATAQAGDVVLLSPACASFDMFENFEERGRIFKKLVANLSPGKETTQQ